MAKCLIGVLLLALCVAAHPADINTGELSCEGYPCRKGLRCLLEEVKCSRAPCPKKPKCQPTCPSAPCNTNYTCVEGECYPMTCERYECRDGWECYMQQIQCSHPPCTEIPLCRQTCDVIQCKKGFSCKVGVCVPDLLCHGVRCLPGEECIINQVISDNHTLESYTPDPAKALCKPNKKCGRNWCKEGFKCVDGHCIQKSDCDGLQCGPGEECFLQDMQCVQAPCPQVASCRSVVMCDTFSCLPGYFCFHGKCIVEPSCEGVHCEPGDECILLHPPCIAPLESEPNIPCLPYPTCRLNLCSTQCHGDYICLYGDCVLKNTTCIGYNGCATGEECYLQSEPCLVTPCPPPSPACRRSCAAIQCLAPSTCISGQCISMPRTAET